MLPFESEQQQHHKPIYLGLVLALTLLANPGIGSGGNGNWAVTATGRDDRGSATRPARQAYEGDSNEAAYMRLFHEMRYFKLNAIKELSKFSRLPWAKNESIPLGPAMTTQATTTTTTTTWPHEVSFEPETTIAPDVGFTEYTTLSSTNDDEAETTTARKFDWEVVKLADFHRKPSELGSSPEWLAQWKSLKRQLTGRMIMNLNRQLNQLRSTLANKRSLISQIYVNDPELASLSAELIDNGLLGQVNGGLPELESLLPAARHDARSADVVHNKTPDPVGLITRKHEPPSSKANRFWLVDPQMALKKQQTSKVARFQSDQESASPVSISISANRMASNNNNKAKFGPSIGPLAGAGGGAILIGGDDLMATSKVNMLMTVRDGGKRNDQLDVVNNNEPNLRSDDRKVSEREMRVRSKRQIGTNNHEINNQRPLTNRKKMMIKPDMKQPVTTTTTSSSAELDDAQTTNYNRTIDSQYSCSRLANAIKCELGEDLVRRDLNHSFPATSDSIESICNNINFLLVSCWPRQLELLRQTSNSMIANNDSFMDDYLRAARDRLEPEITTTTTTSNYSSSSSSRDQLDMTTSNDTGSKRPSRTSECNLDPQVPKFMLDRIHWMWLNLCIDQQFRLEYLANLQCMSLWTPERAQMVCNKEYSLMQMNLGIEQPAVTRFRRATATGSDSKFDNNNNQENNNNNNNVTQLDDAGQRQLASKNLVPDESSDLRPKMICCTLDIFMRCTYMQASHECGPAGGQFVVNYLTRIGPDDLRFICSGGDYKLPDKLTNMRSAASATASISRTTSNPNSARLMSNGRLIDPASPFIDPNICDDLRVKIALMKQVMSSHSASLARVNRKNSTTVSEVNLRNYNMSSKDIIKTLNSFYEFNEFQNRAPSSSSSSSPSSLDPKSADVTLGFVFLIPWIFALCFNGFLLSKLADTHHLFRL